MNQPQHLKPLFQLDPGITFLNHGSFGATPRPVFEVYQEWQRRLERQPVKFLGRDLLGYLAEARRALGEYLNAPADDLAFVPNATHGVNLVARSLRLKPGDQILTTDHEYGACNNTFDFICQRSGAAVQRQAVAVPVESAAKMVEQIWSGVSGRTKIIFLSHITSPTALRLPIEEICRRARSAGILTLIDGAHAPGQIPLDLQKVGADFYTGNCHKWLCAPKGSGFLYARREVQGLLEPLVVSWGWSNHPQHQAGSPFLSNLQWPGTSDFSAYLSVPAAIRFQAEHDWDAVRLRCHQLVKETMHQVCQLTGMEPIYSYDANCYHQMATLPLPEGTDAGVLKSRLYDQYRIEIPQIEWQQRPYIRVSIQGYNSQADVEVLLRALKREYSP
jgi:isopenicillin-N epimerase